MKRHALYPLLNGVFHVVHIFIISFVIVGWIFPSLRLAHLVLLLLTLGSWFILGLWFGPGYCPVTDWHWKIKTKLGEGRPSGTYIHLLLQNISTQKLSSATVDRITLISTVSITALSLALNVNTWLSSQT